MTFGFFHCSVYEGKSHRAIHLFGRTGCEMIHIWLYRSLPINVYKYISVHVERSPECDLRIPWKKRSLCVYLSCKRLLLLLGLWTQKKGTDLCEIL